MKVSIKNWMLQTASGVPGEPLNFRWYMSGVNGVQWGPLASPPVLNKQQSPDTQQCRWKQEKTDETEGQSLIAMKNVLSLFAILSLGLL